MGEIYKNASFNLAMCEVRDAHRSRANVNNVDGNDADNDNDNNDNDNNDNDVDDDDVDNNNHVNGNGNGFNGHGVNGHGANGNNNANGHNNHINGNGLNGNHANGNGVNGNHINGNNANDDVNDDAIIGGVAQRRRLFNDDPSPLPQHAQRFQVAHFFTTGRVVFDILPDWARLTRDHSELYKRGWALQERLLSTRQLHFATVPAFECQRGLYTLAYSQGTGNSPAFHEYLGSEKNWLPEGPLDEEVAFARWLEIIEMYSGKAITNPDDKLMAVCGLAKEFAPLLGVGYYAGVWSGRFFACGLLWTPDGECDAHPLPTYRGRFP